MNAYDREGRPIAIRQWAVLTTRPEYKRVAVDFVGIYAISTVWMGYDHGSGDGPPLIFETTVFPPVEVSPKRRLYSTEAEARAGHDETVLHVRATIQDDVPSEHREGRANGGG